MDTAEQVLIALRQVIRATDIHSRHLAKTIGLTSPQIVLMQIINAQEGVTVSEIAHEMSVSQSTVTNILDRIEGRALVVRERSCVDKRKVTVRLTAEGKRLLKNAPIPLQEHFTEQFDLLHDWEQMMMIAALKRIASMMNAETIDAAPHLHLGRLDATTVDTTASGSITDDNKHKND